MADFQSTAMRRRLAKVERNLADDHDGAANRATETVQRTFHARAAQSCRARADAYDARADREEAQAAQDACR